VLSVEQQQREAGAYLTLRHPCCPIYPRQPYLPKGSEEARERCSTIVWVVGFQ